MSKEQVVDSILNNYTFLGENSVDEEDMDSSFPLYLTWLQKEIKNCQAGLASGEFSTLLDSMIGNESFVMTLQDLDPSLLETCGNEYEENGNLEGLEDGKKREFCNHYDKWLAQMISFTQPLVSGGGEASSATPAASMAQAPPQSDLPRGGGEASLGASSGKGSISDLFGKTPHKQKKELFHGRDMGSGIGIFKEKTPPLGVESIFKKKKSDFSG